MVSFRDLILKLEQVESPEGDENEDAKAMVVIRKGLQIDDNFWDNFKQLCNYADGLAKLLDVDTDKIARWSGRIEQVEQKVRESDEGNAGEKKATVMSTGNEIADTNPRPGGPGNPQGTTEEPRML